MSEKPKLEQTWRDSPEALAFHDVKNHLGVALINAKLLERRLGDAEPRTLHHLQLVQQSLESMSVVCEYLRDYVRLIAVPAPLQSTALSLEAVLEDALETCRAGASGRAPRVDAPPLEGLSLNGEWPNTPRLFSGLFVAVLRETSEGDGACTLRVTKEESLLRFLLEVGALQGDEPASQRHTLVLALATAERLVRAHGGSWEAPVLGQAPLAVRFSLPRAG